MTSTRDDGTAAAWRIDEALAALGHPTRRLVLVEVGVRNPRSGSEFDDLLETAGDPKDARLQLFHNHLPTLDAAGFVVWDPGTDTVRRGPRYEVVRPLIELLRDNREELPYEWP